MGDDRFLSHKMNDQVFPGRLLHAYNKWIKVVGGVFADALFRLPFSARIFYSFICFPNGKEEIKDRRNICQREGPTPTVNGSDRLCWGKTVWDVNSIAPNSSLTSIRVQCLCCSLPGLASILLLPVYFNPLIHYAQHVFAWVPDGKKTKQISSFRLPASPKFAKRHEEKEILPRDYLVHSSSSGERNNNIYSQFKALCAHRSSSRLHLRLFLYINWLHYIELADWRAIIL